MRSNAKIAVISRNKEVIIKIAVFGRNDEVMKINPTMRSNEKLH